MECDYAETRDGTTYEPVANDRAQLGLNAAQQLHLEEVLTQAIGALVAGAHAAETGVAVGGAGGETHERQHAEHLAVTL